MVKKRLFLALPILETDPFTRIIDQLKSSISRDEVQFTKLENLHLTLRFIGETSEKDQGKIVDMMKVVSDDFFSFKSEMRKVGLFGSSYAPRVIWAGWHDEGMSAKLNNVIINGLESIGFPSDRQNFVPHLTLARIRRIENKSYFQQTMDTIKENFFGSQTNTKIILYESILEKEGPRYVALQEFRLKDYREGL